MSRCPAPLSRAAAWVVFGSLALFPISMAQAQVSPEESARQVKPAEGLEATLWAAEPLVINPTNIDIDSRGRVWVTEGLNYRLHRNQERNFNKLDDADQIKILEDTDGDGKADKVTIFADKIFPVPMGIAVEERYDEAGNYAGCKVYVGNSPNLLVLEDTDGDDKADIRYPLLTGFGGIDSDHGVHGMTLGLDGKLYFTHGDGCCSVQPDGGQKTENFDVTDESGRRVSTDQLATTLRVNRDGTQFEVLADRQRNNYEVCLNAFGNIFVSDNDDDGNRGCRVIWIMDGGSYGYRTPGSPRHWGEEVPGSVPKLVGTGNGSPCGIMVYEGSLLPGPYRGGLFEVDAGTRQVNFFPLTREGAAFRTEYEVLLSSDDPWFRPVDATAAPDGSVFVADWYDGGVGGHAFRDQTTGRIYRVAPQKTNVEIPNHDFSSVAGLIEALKSPVVATQDAARRGLIERGKEAADALSKLFADDDPIFRARALWTLQAIQGDGVAIFALNDADPRIREQAARMLGRDVSRVANVEDPDPQPLAALDHINSLLANVEDPDAGVRRELILAFRDVSTEQVGESLRQLAATWDGQDRWYLEALGLALRDRESEFLKELFDGSLYGAMDLETLGNSLNVALPPYYPVDRNEAFLSASDELPPANALTKTLGLMWQLQRPEALPLLAQILPKLNTPDLQQAADDVLMQISDPAGAVALAKLLKEVENPIRQGQILSTLARRLSGPWRDAAEDPAVVEAIEAAIQADETRAEGIAAAAATGQGRYAKAMLEFLQNDSAPAPVRVAAVEALGKLQPEGALERLQAIVDQAVESENSNPVAEAALRTLPALEVPRGRFLDMVTDLKIPLGLRREALAISAVEPGTARRLLDLVREEKLPNDLRTAATVALTTHGNRQIRDEAGPLLSLAGPAGGRELPPFAEMARFDGDPDRGREVFFREASDSCGTCHRVQGQGDWIGPDLSTISTKYGKDDLLRHIVDPSDAIGYNYRAYVVALNDGRVLTGLPVEESTERLVLKTAEGQRLELTPDAIEEQRQSDVSLMPEGLLQSLTDQEIGDLLAYLTTLRQPVSIIGEYQAVGPIVEAGGRPLIDIKSGVHPSEPLSNGEGPPLPWRRLRADAESRVDLTSLATGDDSQAVYLFAPVTSPADQEARLVLDAPTKIQVWLNGEPLELSAITGQGNSQEVPLQLKKGSHELLIRVAGGPESSIVTTIVADLPLEFTASDAKQASAR